VVLRYLFAKFGIRLGQQPQRARDGVVIGVLLLDDRIDVPAQVAAHQLVDKRDRFLKRRFAVKRPVGADDPVQLDLVQRALQLTFDRTQLGAALGEPARAHFRPQLLQNRADVRFSRLHALATVAHGRIPLVFDPGEHYSISRRGAQIACAIMADERPLRK
jgi:hypothetical protein